MFASVPIHKGCPILFNYVKPMDSILTRKDSLQNFKFFNCLCIRCQDTTDLNTFVSAYLCSECEVGPVVLTNDKWTCHDCEAILDEAKTKKIELEITAGKQKLAKILARVDLAQARQLLKDFTQMLYPSHGFILEIKQVLVTCTAAAVNNPGKEAQLESMILLLCLSLN